MKANVGDLEEDVRKLLTRNMRKEFTGVVEEDSGNKRLMKTFHYGFNKYIRYNKLNVMTVVVITKTKEAEVPTKFLHYLMKQLMCIRDTTMLYICNYSVKTRMMPK